MRFPKRFVVLAALLAAVVAGVSAAPARSGSNRETLLRPLNSQIATAINAFRVAHGLNPLRVSPRLDAAARQHSLEMGADGYFDHNSADGTIFWKRIERFFPQTHYSYWTVGENLLWASPTVDAPTAMQMWIASPAHLANLKNRNWTALGVSAVHVLDAGGVYGDNDVTIITTDFGARH